jgi:hypothetical protein
MTQRSPFVVFLLGAITFGIYPLVWFVGTKEEMNRQGAQIPTAWLLLVPIANLIWMWKWCTGVAHVTRGATGAGFAFAMLLLLGPIGMAVLQSAFNKRQLAAAPGGAHAPLAA